MHHIAGIAVVGQAGIGQLEGAVWQAAGVGDPGVLGVLREPGPPVRSKPRSSISNDGSIVGKAEFGTVEFEWTLSLAEAARRLGRVGSIRLRQVSVGRPSNRSVEVDEILRRIRCLMKSCCAGVLSTVIPVELTIPFDKRLDTDWPLPGRYMPINIVEASVLTDQHDDMLDRRIGFTPRGHVSSSAAAGRSRHGSDQGAAKSRCHH